MFAYVVYLGSWPSVSPNGAYSGHVLPIIILLAFLRLALSNDCLTIHQPIFSIMLIWPSYYVQEVFHRNLTSGGDCPIRQSEWSVNLAFMECHSTKSSQNLIGHEVSFYEVKLPKFRTGRAVSPMFKPFVIIA